MSGANEPESGANEPGSSANQPGSSANQPGSAATKPESDANDPAPSSAPHPFPEPGSELTHILVVADVQTSRAWYADVLGATLYREYGGDSAVFQFQGAWLLLVTGGPPTDDKPSVTFAYPADPDVVTSAFTIRVQDCRGSYETLRSRGALFLTPPLTRGRETRCFFRDPDGHLFEISEYR